MLDFREDFYLHTVLIKQRLLELSPPVREGQKIPQGIGSNLRHNFRATKKEENSLFVQNACMQNRLNTIICSIISDHPRSSQIFNK